MVEVILPDGARQCQLAERVTSTRSTVYRSSVIVLTAFLAGCAARGATPAPFPSVASAKPKPEIERAARERVVAEGESVGTTGRLSGALRAREMVVQNALSVLGRPYVPGGSGPSGFDCSGLVQYAYARAGFSVPRTVAEQLEASEPVGRDEIAPGDLLFFRVSGRKPSHVGIALGDGTFVHAPSERGEVRIERLDSDYWSSRFVSARSFGEGR